MVRPVAPLTMSFCREWSCEADEQKQSDCWIAAQGCSGKARAKRSLGDVNRRHAHDPALNLQPLYNHSWTYVSSGMHANPSPQPAASPRFTRSPLVIFSVLGLAGSATAALTDTRVRREACRARRYAAAAGVASLRASILKRDGVIWSVICAGIGKMIIAEWTLSTLCELDCEGCCASLAFCVGSCLGEGASHPKSR